MRRLILMIMALLMTLTGVSAQDQTTLAIALSDNFGTLNPLLNSNPAFTSLVWSRLFDVDTETGTHVAGMADSWEISADGLTYTVHLRDDLLWSDGTPITSADYAFTFQAIRSEALASPLSRAFPPEVFDSFTVVDDDTFTFSIARPNCSLLTRLNSVFALPSHRFAQDFLDVADNSIFTQDGVSSGPYTLVVSTAGDSVTLSANANYWKGAPLIPNLTLHVLTDTQEAVQALADGSIDLWSSLVPFVANTGGASVILANGVTPSLTPDERVRLADETGLFLPEDTILFQTPGIGVTSLVLNSADPENPQARYDASGNRFDQGAHPIFGDVRVRRALAQAVDVASMSLGSSGLFSTGGNLVTPQSWAYQPDLPQMFRPDEAVALLEEAGWVDDDGDPETPRVCEGCEYSADGDPFAFELTYDPFRPELGWIAQVVQQQFGALGAEVTLVPNEVPPPGAPSTILNQRFDMALITLGSFPTDPSFSYDTLLFSTADVPDRGFNIASFANDQVDQLLSQARSLPGCDLEARAELYQRVQALLSDEAVYIPLGMLLTNYAANKRIDGFNPAIGQPFWNIETWRMDQAPGT